MATTGQNFILTGGTGTALIGSTVGTNPQAMGVDPISAESLSNAAGPSGSGVQTETNDSATIVDRILFDMAASSTTVHIGEKYYAPGLKVGGFAKNGMLMFTLTGTTAVTFDMTTMGSSVGVTSTQAGDTSLATCNCLILRNLSSAASTFTVAPGASNPLTFPNALGGTSPTISMLAGDCVCMYAVTGSTVNSTHKTVTITPTAGGTFAVVYGGA